MSAQKSKFLDNKQIIHIATEVVVLLGLVFYFSSKNKKLANSIEELAQRMEAYEEQIQKMESIISRMGEALNVMQRSLQSRVVPVNTVPMNNLTPNPSLVKATKPAKLAINSVRNNNTRNNDARNNDARLKVLRKRRVAKRKMVQLPVDNDSSDTEPEEPNDVPNNDVMNNIVPSNQNPVEEITEEEPGDLSDSDQDIANELKDLEEEEDEINDAMLSGLKKQQS